MHTLLQMSHIFNKSATEHIEYKTLKLGVTQSATESVQRVIQSGNFVVCFEHSSLFLQHLQSELGLLN